MKYIFTALCLLSFIFSSSAQGSEDFYATHWLKVYRLEVKELPKSALEIVDSIYNRAASNNDAAQQIKALVYKSKFALTLEEDAELKVVNQFKAEIAQSDPVNQAILRNYLAKMYNDYFQHNRWKIYNRTKSSKVVDSVDFRTWDIQTMQSTIRYVYEQSLKNWQLLEKSKVDNYSILIDRYDSVDKYRPTLLDVLAHNVILYYKSNQVTFEDNTFQLDSTDFASLNTLHYPDSLKGTEVEIMQLYKKLYAFHFSRKDTNAFIDLDLERLKYVADQVNNDALYLKSLKQLKQSVRQHPASALIDFAIASQLYDENKKAEALEVCNTTIPQFPDSDGVIRCSALKTSILAKSLNVTTESYVLPDKPSKLLIEYTNIDSLYFRVYPLSYKEKQTFDDLRKDSIRNAFIQKLTPQNHWSVKLIDPEDYYSHATEVVVPKLAKGTYLIVGSNQDHTIKTKSMMAFSTVQVTSLALLDATVGNQKRFQLVDRYTGRPVPEGTIHIQNDERRNDFEATDHKIVTDIQGFAFLPLPKRYSYIQTQVYYEGDTVAFGSDYINGRQNENQRSNIGNDYVTAKAFLFTDRSIYRPGQTVYFKGILLKKANNRSSIITGEYVEVYLEDVNGDEVGFLRLKTNEYGSFSGKFDIPDHGLNGEYTLYADMDYEENSKFYDEIMDDFEWNEHYISVEEYKRPTFEVIFDPVKATYQVNDTVKVAGKAESFSGAALTNAKVSYSVQRVVQYPIWWFRPSWQYKSPVEITSGEALTDENGAFTIPFKAVPDNDIDKDGLPVFNYKITADVTDISGETRSNNTTVKVGYHTLEASLSIPENIDLSDKNTPQLAYDIKNLNGEPVASKGKINIYTLKADSVPVRKRPWMVPDQPLLSEAEYKKLFPHEAYKEITDWKQHEKDELKATYNINTAMDKSISLDKPLTPGRYVAELTTEDTQGNKVITKTFFKVFNSNANKVSNNQLMEVRTDKASYAMGEDVKLSLGTASKALTVVVEIDKNHTINETRMVHLSDEIKTLTVPVEKSDADGFAIHYYYVNYNSFDKGTELISVKRPDENIQIETVTFRDKIMPGAKETWAFRVKGKKKERTEVEFLASMYDASLDQFKQHQWQFDPNPTQRYYAYNLVNTNSFNPKSFAVNHIDYTVRYYRAPVQRHTSLNNFGFSLGGLYANRQYLNRLRAFDLNAKSTAKFESDKTKSEGYIYGTVTSQKDGSPLPGVTVVVKGTSTGTVTDIDGHYTLPYKKGQGLIFSFVGFQTLDVNPENKNIIDVQMAEDVQQLSEVVVTGYGQVLKKNAMSASVQNIELEADEEAFYQLAGKTAGVQISQGEGTIRIRGNSSVESGKDPLFVVDGVILENAANIQTSDLASLKILKGEEATTLYGARGANGVIIITTKSGQKKIDEMLAKVKARKDLRETAFFFPHLVTDKQGEIRFTFNTPEALTRWKLQLLAHNKALKIGYKSLSTVTQKELMVMPNAPRFLRKGDKLEFVAKVVNLTENPQQVQAVLSLFDAITGEEISTSLVDSLRKETLVPSVGSNKVSWTFKVPEQFNAIQYKIVATNGTYSDGEQSIIPVLSNRQLITETLPMTVKANANQTFELEKLTHNTSKTLKSHQVILEVTTNPIWYVVKSLPYLMEYPYECSEQTFSRLYANLLASEIVKKNPAIKKVFQQWKSSDALVSNLEKNPELKSILIQETPWLRDAQNETQQQKRIALLFDLDKISQLSEDTFKKLYQMQFNRGGFPWFSGSNLPNRYITQHIIAGFGHLQHLGITPDFEDYPWMVKGAIKYLDSEIVKDYKKLLADSADLSKMHINKLQVQYLYARSFFDQEQSEEVQQVIAYYQDQASTYRTDFELLPKAMIALSLYRSGHKQIALDITQSLTETSIMSDDLGMYWKANTGGYYWNEAPIETQALLIEAFNEIKPEDSNKQEELNAMKNWLFQHKQVNQWPTTKATTEAIYAVLMNEKLAETSTGNVEVKVGEHVITPEKIEDGSGYLKENYGPEEITNGMGKVSITNNSDHLVYGGLYWQYFEQLDHVTASSTGALHLSKRIFKVTRDQSGEVLNPVGVSTKLQLGDLIRVRITLKTDRDMEFLHMKDQRASGLEPVSTLSKYKWQDGLGYYQSTEDASTNFFFDAVPKGVYVFEYDLRINVVGDFSNGITTIQSMYAPEFSSQSDSRRVLIEK